MQRKKLQQKDILLNISGGCILAFGLYHVHALSGVTEGGILGLILFLNHWLKLSPAWSGLVLNAICYGIGYKILGKGFIPASIVAGGSFSLFYFIFEQFPPLWPSLAQMPLLAAVLGAVFVGVGVGLCVRAGGAPSGDDALAMGLAKYFNKDIRIFYFISDVFVLLLSLTYIAPLRLLYSFLTVMLSTQIVGLFQIKKNALT